MKEEAYRFYSNFFGHDRLLNWFVNRFSNTSIEMGKSVGVGRNTELYGNIDIGSNVTIGPKSRFNGDIDIGEHTSLSGNNSLFGEISIGKACAIARHVRMISTNHPTYKPGVERSFYDYIGADLGSVSKGPIEIGNDVWICSDAKILSGVSIGNGAVIAANSVVVDDVEPYSVVAGNPATHKKYRFDESKRETLQEIKWWDWSEEKKKRNVEFFESDLREIEDVRSLIEE